MTRPVSLLNLGLDIAQAHQRSAAGAVALIPVIVDELSAALPVLEALATMLEGVLLNCEDDHLQRPVRGTSDVIRRAAVGNALTTAPSGETRRVELRDTPDGELDAVFVDPPAGPDPSEGEKMVLAVARALAHADLDLHTFAVVSFSAFAIDFPFRNAIWSLAVDQFRGMPSRTLQTLVLVAEDTIEVSLHCQTDRGFRLAVQGQRLLRRRGRDELNAHAARLAANPDPLVLFLGAGFGYSTGLPLGNGVRDSAIRRLLDVDVSTRADSDALARRFHTWIAEREWMTPSEARLDEAEYIRQLTLEQVIRAEQRFNGGALPTLAEFRAHHDALIDAPGQAVTDLAFILSQRVGRIILVEVNFDRLIEHHAVVPVRAFASDTEFSDAAEYIRDYLEGTETDVPLLKLHGDINAPETCVVSADQTELGVGEPKLAALRTLVGPPLTGEERRAWIYVGTSMRDKDLVPILQSEEFARGLEELWVVPYVPDTVETFAAGRLPFWQKRDWTTLADRLITEQADAFFAAWRAAL